MRISHFLWPVAYTSLAIATCYNPNGSPVAGNNVDVFLPCNQVQSSFSMCCGTNWTNGIVANDVCLSNGLCLNSFEGKPLYWRGTCTDATWKSPRCLSNLCTTNQMGGDPTQNVAVSQCNDGSWCCGGSFNATCCANKLGVFLDGTIGTPNSTTSATIIDSLSTTVSTTSTGTSAAVASTSQSALNDSTTSTANPAAPTSSTNSLAIGLGVGLGGALLIAVGGSYILFRRKRRVTDQSASHNPTTYYRAEMPATTELSQKPSYMDGAENTGGWELDSQPRAFELSSGPH